MAPPDQPESEQSDPPDKRGNHLHASDEWLRLIMESAREYAIFTTDLDFTVTSWNPGATHVLGYRDEEIIGEDSRKFFTPEDRTNRQPERERDNALQKGRAEDVRWHVRKGGARFWGNGMAMPLRDHEGNVHGLLKILQDRTEQKKAEDALKESEERLRETHAVLEQRVRERTEQLEQANKQLQAEIEERKRMERVALEASEREQRRMGQDLHDTLCQSLAGISLMARVLARRLRSDRPYEAQEAVRIGDLLQEAVDETRNIARGLHPVEFERGGLLAALLDLALSSGGSVRCAFDPPEAVTITDPVIALHVYRIAQEAVANAVKHARAKNIEIELRRRGGIVLTVRDDGVGLDPGKARRNSMGMELMRYRASVIGAALSVSSSGENGTTVECVVPSTS